jgi:hypothetical protein
MQGERRHVKKRAHSSLGIEPAEGSTHGFGCVTVATLVNREAPLMTMETHLAELERRHRNLEREIEDAMQHPGIDTLTLTELKRRKLSLKDEIEKLRTESVH